MSGSVLINKGGTADFTVCPLAKGRLFLFALGSVLGKCRDLFRIFNI
jgi:hypothetical protein